MSETRSFLLFLLVSFASVSLVACVVRRSDRRGDDDDDSSGPDDDDDDVGDDDEVGDDDGTLFVSGTWIQSFEFSPDLQSAGFTNCSFEIAFSGGEDPAPPSGCPDCAAIFAAAQTIVTHDCDWAEDGLLLPEQSMGLAGPLQGNGAASWQAFITENGTWSEVATGQASSGTFSGSGEQIEADFVIYNNIEAEW